MRLHGILICLLFCGCTHLLPPHDGKVSSIIHERVQKQVHWNKEPPSSVICQLLKRELTDASAIQVALLNNPNVQATFAQIGIAYADLIEAGLFKNPLFEAYVRFPTQDLAINTQFSIAQSFMDIFLIPLKKKVAAAELEQTKLLVANKILDLAFEVQETFYSYVATKIKMEQLRVLVDAADVAKDLAKLQREQGNINDLELQMQVNKYLQAKIAYTESQIELVALREEMNKLLGLASNDCWESVSTLPQLPQMELSTLCLEHIALRKRLDIGQSRWELEKLSRMLQTKQWWSYANGELGLSSEHEAEGFQETGPTLSIPLPLFNYGQGDRARIKALYAQSYHHLRAQQIAVRSEVRAAREQLLVRRQLIEEYQNQLLPLQEAIVSTSQAFYNYMALGVYKLIDAKSQEIEAQIRFTEARLSYFKSRINLDRSLGGNLQWALREGAHLEE